MIFTGILLCWLIVHAIKKIVASFSSAFMWLQWAARVHLMPFFSAFQNRAISIIFSTWKYQCSVNRLPQELNSSSFPLESFISKIQMFSGALLQFQFSNNPFKGLNVDDVNICSSIISVLLLPYRKVETLYLSLTLPCLWIHWLH